MPRQRPDALVDEATLCDRSIAIAVTVTAMVVVVIVVVATWPRHSKAIQCMLHQDVKVIERGPFGEITVRWRRKSD